MMNKLKSIISSFLATCLFFVAGTLFVSSANAATISVSPSSSTLVIGNDIQITVKVDAGTTQIFGAQATINYPSDSFTVKNITPGNFFTDNITPVQSTGQILLQGTFFNAVSGTGTGNGTFATITLTATKAAGTGTVGFVCNGSYHDTYILDSANNNILACGSLNHSEITFSSGATVQPTPSPTPGGGGGTTPSTNACGGTCGSVYNCNTGLFCYQGFCRNPDCPGSSSCGCTNPTATPRSTPRPTFRATPTGTPVVIALATFTPYPSFVPGISPTPLAEVPQSSFLKPVYLWAVLIILAIIIIWVAIRAIRRNSPPKITPPTGNVPPTFPSTPPPVTPPQTY